MTLCTVTAYRFSPGRIDGKHIFPLLAVPSVPSSFRPLPFVFIQFGTSPKWPWDSSAPTKNWCRSVRTLRHQLFGAEVSWCRSVLTPIVGASTGNWTLRLRDTLPTGQFAYCLVISPTGHAYWSFRLQDISPTGQFAYWTVCLLDISPTAWTVRLQIANFAYKSAGIKSYV